MSDGTYVNEPLPGGGSQVTEIDTHEVDFGAGDIRKRQRVSLAGTDPDSDVLINSGALSVFMSNLPSSYPLPTGQVTALTPQTDALTNTELRATPVPTSNSALADGTQVTKLSANGAVVDGAHPLPISGTFSDPNGVPFSSSNPLPVDVGGSITIDNLTATFDSQISTLNTTTTPLAANASFVGTWEEVVNFAAISVVILTDAWSAVNGATVEFSADGTNVISNAVATIPPDTPGYFAFAPRARYFRVNYTNGPVAQTSLQAEVTFRFNPPANTIQAIESPVYGSYEAELSRSAIMARQSDPGVYVNIHATADNELNVHDESSGVFLDNRYGGGKTAFAGQVTASGDTTVITPASGSAVQVYWIYAVSDPNNSSSPLITVKLGTESIYCGYALSHWEVFTGAVDDPLIINLDQAISVAVTVHYKEV